MTEKELENEKTRELIKIVLEESDTPLIPIKIAPRINRAPRTTRTLIREMVRNKEISLHVKLEDMRNKYYGAKGKDYAEYTRINRFEIQQIPNGMQIPRSR